MKLFDKVVSTAAQLVKLKDEVHPTGKDLDWQARQSELSYKHLFTASVYTTDATLEGKPK